MQELLSALGRNIGIPELTFDEYHYCCLALDNVIVNLEWDADTEMLFLYAHVGHLPVNPTPELYETLLEANFFHRHTAGATLGMDKPSGTIALAQRQATANLNLTLLEKLLEQFVNTAAYWIDEIERLKTTPAPSNQALDLSTSFIRI